MKQVLQSNRSGEVGLAEVPPPALGPGSVLVETRASLISAGTERMLVSLAKKSLLGKARARPDLVRRVLEKVGSNGLGPTLSKVFSKLDTPIALGYSCAGVVREVGADVEGLAVGDRVACAGAGYANHAEINSVPKNLCCRIPEEVSFEDASFATVGAIALQGVRQGDPKLGERVVVIGLGLIGLLTVQLLRAAGCAVLGSDPSEERRRLAVELGAEASTTPSELVAKATALTRGQGADLVIIAAATSSNDPIESAAEVARAKGRVVAVGEVGLDVPRDEFYRKELDLRLSMSYGPGRYDPEYEEGGRDYPFAYVRWTEQRNLESFLYLVSTGAVSPGRLVGHRFDLDDALQAYELLAKGDPRGADGPPGIVLTYPEANERTIAKVIRVAPTSATGRITIGFIGAGNFARSVLLPALAKEGRAGLSAVCTATGTSASETAKKFGFELATTDSRVLLGSEEINTIFIATRHDSHAPLASAALAAGKNVFVEKPLAIREEHLDLYQEALESRGEKQPCLLVGFNRHFSPHTTAVREVFQGRQSPMVVRYRVNAGPAPTGSWIQDPEIGGGRIVGEICHFVDFCEAVIGSCAADVYAASVSSSDEHLVAQDSLSLTMRYADGSLATIDYLALGSGDVPKERIEIHADGMTAIVDDFRRTEFHGNKRPAVRGRQDKGFEAEIRAFLDVVEHGGAWPIPWESLLRTSRTTFAAGRSLRTGLPVALD